MEEQFQRLCGISLKASNQFLDHPIQISPEVKDSYIARGSTLREYFRKVVELARWSLTDDGLQSEAHRILFSELPKHLDRDWHLGLPGEAWTDPQWFRTDESSDGKIYEVQCPGSGWGDLHLVASAYNATGTGNVDPYRIVEQFVSDAQAITKQDEPVVLHLLDNSSTPWSMRYFIQATRGRVKYFGFDTEVGTRDVSLIRSHSFYGLAAENLFLTRLGRLTSGANRFDLPPHVTFDQKAGILLPFHQATRDYFSDDIRRLFPYTALATPLGFAGPEGEFTKWDNLIALAKRGERYWLKYGGPDTNINWGSAGVFRLGDANQRRWIDMAIDGTSRGQVWLVQTSASSRSDPYAPEDDMYSKISNFYGPSGLYGTKFMFSKHFKPHGQPQTLVSIGH